MIRKYAFRFMGSLFCMLFIVTWLSPRPILTFSFCRTDTTLYSHQVCIYEDRTFYITTREKPDYGKFFAKHRTGRTVLTESDYTMLLEYANQLTENPAYLERKYVGAVQSYLDWLHTSYIAGDFTYLSHVDYRGNKMMMTSGMDSDDDDVRSYFGTMFQLTSNIWSLTPISPMLSGHNFEDRHWIEELFDTYIISFRNGNWPFW